MNKRLREEEPITVSMVLMTKKGLICTHHHNNQLNINPKINPKILINGNQDYFLTAEDEQLFVDVYGFTFYDKNCIKLRFENMIFFVYVVSEDHLWTFSNEDMGWFIFDVTITDLPPSNHGYKFMISEEVGMLCVNAHHVLDAIKHIEL